MKNRLIEVFLSPINLIQYLNKLDLIGASYHFDSRCTDVDRLCPGGNVILSLLSGQKKINEDSGITEIRMQTDNGTKVILHADGTWTASTEIVVANHVEI